MEASRLHPLRRNGPHAGVEIDLRPRQVRRLAEPARGEDDELQQEPHGLVGISRPHRAHGLGDPSVRKARVVLRLPLDLAEHDLQLGRRIVGPVVVRRDPIPPEVAPRARLESRPLPRHQCDREVDGTDARRWLPNPDRSRSLRRRKTDATIVGEPTTKGLDVDHIPPLCA